MNFSRVQTSVRLAIFSLTLSAGAQVKNSVSLLKNGDTGFEEFAKARFSPAYSKLTPAMGRSTAILRNQSVKTVAAYVIKWTTSEGAQTGSSYQISDDLSLLQPHPASIVGLGVEPGAARIINPVFNLHQSEVARVDTDPAFLAALGSSAANRVNTGGTYTPSLDLLIYDDGTFEGPDEGNGTKRLIAERNGQHDAGVEVLLTYEQCMWLTDIQAILATEMEKGQTASVDPGPASYYLQARGRWAWHLSTILERRGEPALRRNATNFANLTSIKLKRIPDQGTAP